MYYTGIGTVRQVFFCIFLATRFSSTATLPDEAVLSLSIQSPACSDMGRSSKNQVGASSDGQPAVNRL